MTDERNYCMVPDCDEQPEVNGELCRTHESETLSAAQVPASGPREEPKEVCLCAALLMADGFIVRGHRHDDAIMTAMGYTRYVKGDLHKAVQGFLTTADRFVTREEGMLLMKATDRVSRMTGRPFTEGHDMLFSEDLY